MRSAPTSANDHQPKAKMFIGGWNTAKLPPISTEGPTHKGDDDSQHILVAHSSKPMQHLNCSLPGKNKLLAKLKPKEEQKQLKDEPAINSDTSVGGGSLHGGVSDPLKVTPRTKTRRKRRK